MNVTKSRRKGGGVVWEGHDLCKGLSKKTPGAMAGQLEFWLGLRTLLWRSYYIDAQLFDELQVYGNCHAPVTISCCESSGLRDLLR